MGGLGSGSYYRWRSGKKTTVEESKSLDANRWMREGILRAGVHLTGSWRWVYRGGRENSISYEVNTLDADRPFVQLFYSITRGIVPVQTSLNYSIRLTTTRPRFGGVRWWFVCPLVVRSIPCERRVGKLYLPPGRQYFGCRACHDLTYRSCQEHDKRVDFLRKHPEGLQRLAENLDRVSLTQLGLILKALRV